MRKRKRAEQKRTTSEQSTLSLCLFFSSRSGRFFLLLLPLFSSRRPLWSACSPPESWGRIQRPWSLQTLPHSCSRDETDLRPRLGVEKRGEHGGLGGEKRPAKTRRQSSQCSPLFFQSSPACCFFHPWFRPSQLRSKLPCCSISPTSSSHLGDLARSHAGGGGRGRGGLGGEAAERRAEGRGGGGGRGLGGRFREHAPAGRGDARERVPGRRGRGTRGQAPQDSRAGHGSKCLGFFLFPGPEKGKEKAFCERELEEKTRPLLRPRPRPPPFSLFSVRGQLKNGGLLQMKK